MAPWLTQKIISIEDAYFQTIALDDFLIIGSPGEFSGELALKIKEYSTQQSVASTITSFNGCYLGYITPIEYYNLNEYETRLMSFFGRIFGGKDSVGNDSDDR